MRYRYLYLAAASLIGASAIAAATTSFSWNTPPERKADSTARDRWGSSYIPNYEVLDQDGNRFRFYDDLLKNKKVIINFIYTTCTDICPLTTARMASLQEKLGDLVGRDVYMYSITIDPEHDDPAALKRYTDAFRVKPGWRFLTGKPRDIAEIRWKLGERSKSLYEHRHEMLLGDVAAGNWSKDSAFGELERVALNVKLLIDPDWQKKHAQVVHADDGSKLIPIDPDRPGEVLFQKMCASCHTVGGGDKVGPDLHRVTSRRDRAWLLSFISNPDKAFRNKDPLAMELLAKFPAVRMPALGLSEVDAGDVLSFIDRESQAVVEAERRKAASR